jgi:flagellar biosynthesis protein FlhA
MDPGDAKHRIQGVETREPAFNLPALWVPELHKEEAMLAGYTVVDPATVIATHLTEVFKRHLHEFLGRQEVQTLLETLSKRAPKVVEELVPGAMNLGGVQKVLQNLVREGVSIRDLLTVAETMADYAGSVKDPDQLTEYVRSRMGRTIVKPYLTGEGALPIMTLAPKVEGAVQESVRQTDHGAYLAMEPGLAQRIIQAIQKAMDKATLGDGQPVLLTSPLVRPHLAQLLSRFIPNLPVISQAEIPAEIKLQSLANIGLTNAG